MPIKLLFGEWDLVRARQILSSWTSLKRFSNDEVDVIVRMIAEGIAEGRRHGFEMAEAEWPSHAKNHLQELKDGLGAKSCDDDQNVELDHTHDI